MSANLGAVLTSGIIYRVVTPTKCKTLRAGDRIRRDRDGMLQNYSAGWLNPGEWERYRCRVEIDRPYYHAQIEEAQKVIRHACTVLDIDSGGVEV